MMSDRQGLQKQAFGETNAVQSPKLLGARGTRGQARGPSLPEYAIGFLDEAVVLASG
jgi:hypothetical protein